MTKQPTKEFFIKTGEKFAVKFVVWDNSMTIQNMKKNGSKWEETNKAYLNNLACIHLFARLPVCISYLDKKFEENKNG